MSKLLSLGNIIDQTWDSYKKHFSDLLNVSGWLLVLAIVQSCSLLFYPTATTLAAEIPLTGWEQFGVTLYAISSIIIAPVIGLWIFASIARLVKGQGGLRRTKPSDALKEGWRFFFPSLLVSFLILALLAAGVVIGIGPSIVVWALAVLTSSRILLLIANLLIVLGVFVALFINFRWSLHYIMAPYAVLVDDVRGKKAMKESRRLVDGRFWSVLLRIAVPKILFIIIGVIGMWILASLSQVVISALASGNIDLFLRLQTIAGIIISIIAAILINPLVVIADVILYKNLQETK